MEDTKIVQLDMEQLKVLLTNAVGEMAKQMGLDKVDRKHGMFPGDTEEDEKSLSKGQRFRKWLSKAIESKAFSPLYETGTTGSYLMPVEYAQEVIDVIGQFGKARRYCTVWNVSTGSYLIPDLSTDISVTIPGEKTEFSESNPVFGQKTLTIKTVGAISTVSNELLADTGVDLLAYIARRFGAAIAKFEDTHTFGNANTYFSPLTYASLSGVATAVTIGSTSIANVSADDLMAMRRGISEDYWPNAKYFMHPYILSYVEQLKDANGQYLVRQPADSAQPRTLWGHEIVTVSGMASTDAAATVFIGFADPQMCVLGVRQELALKLAEEAVVASDSMFENNASALRVLERFGQVWTNTGGAIQLKTAST